jgi:hypothetical protein
MYAAWGLQSYHAPSNNNNNNIYNTNNTIFYINTFNYNTNNYILKPKSQEPWVQRRTQENWVLTHDPLALGPNATCL